jgi:hypothetical protein
MKRILLFACMLLICTLAMAQNPPEKKKLPFDLGVDLMSRYVWRGQCLDKNPNIQPWFVYAPKFGLKVGAWGSYSVGGDFAEVDLFAATDYFIMNESWANNHFFNYNKTTTGHLLEATLAYEGTEKFPIKVVASTMLYGADKIVDQIIVDTVMSDTTYSYKNAYSTYFEIGYTIRNISLFVGVTPMNGFYGSKASIVNAGISAKKNIKITDSFSLPIQAALVFNPHKENIFLVFGFSF